MRLVCLLTNLDGRVNIVEIDYCDNGPTAVISKGAFGRDIGAMANVIAVR
jgi:hypothetical protein